MGTSFCPMNLIVFGTDYDNLDFLSGGGVLSADIDTGV